MIIFCSPDGVKCLIEELRIYLIKYVMILYLL